MLRELCFNVLVGTKILIVCEDFKVNRLVMFFFVLLMPANSILNL